MQPITAITVIYNSAAVLPGLVASLPADMRLIVVDNGPDDGMRAWARSRGLHVIVSPENLGFGRGCNLGAAQADGDFLLFINPDARLDPDAIPHLLAAAGRNPDAAAFGPVLMTHDGKPRYKRNSYLLPHQPKPPRDPGTADRPVGMLSGAVLLVRRAAFVAVGGFDSDIFLYFEDDDLSLRLTRDAGPLILAPLAHAHHDNGHSSPPSPALSRFKGYHWARSRIHTGRKHGRALPWLSGLWDGISHTLSPRSWRDPAHRNEGLGRIWGALSVWRG